MNADRAHASPESRRSSQKSCHEGQTFRQQQAQEATRFVQLWLWPVIQAEIADISRFPLPYDSPRWTFVREQEKLHMRETENH